MVPVNKDKVLKALGICSEKIKGDCPDCPYNMIKKGSCIAQMCEDAYSLISEYAEGEANA